VATARRYWYQGKVGAWHHAVDKPLVCTLCHIMITLSILQIVVVLLGLFLFRISFLDPLMMLE